MAACKVNKRGESQAKVKLKWQNLTFEKADMNTQNFPREPNKN